MKQKLLVYIIGAYSGDTKANIAKAEAASIALIRAGYHVFTPHKNTAGYEKYEGSMMNMNNPLPHVISWNTWIEMDLHILSKCDAIFIMDNAKDSHGSKIEIEFAKSRNIPEVTL